MRHHLRHGFLAALSLIAAAPACALDLPARKAGLWEVKATFEGRNLPPQVMQQCIDAATDKMMNALGGSLQQSMCSKQEVQKVGNTLVVDSVCQMGGMSTTSHGVITGDFSSGGATNMTIETKHLGACKADQKPGDMIMADGRKINIVDMQNMLPPNMRGAGQKK